MAMARRNSSTISAVMMMLLAFSARSLAMIRNPSIRPQRRRANAAARRLNVQIELPQRSVEANAGVPRDVDGGMGPGAAVTVHEGLALLGNRRPGSLHLVPALASALQKQQMMR